MSQNKPDNSYPIWDDVGWLAAIRINLVEELRVEYFVRPGLLPDDSEFSSIPLGLLYAFWLQVAGGFVYGQN